MMPALSNKTYFNYGGQGPLPTPSLDAIYTSWQKIQTIGPFTNNIWPFILNEIANTKKELSTSLNVDSSQIALTENVTSGCVLPLWGIPFNEGDHILISDCEHPGIFAACQELARRKKLKIDLINVKDLLKDGKEILKIFDQFLHQKTKLAVISHILWNTGQLMPIQEISDLLGTHKNKPYLLVDAAQSFGQIPIEGSAQAADIYAFTGHKWACGPEGLGGVALSNRILEESPPTIIGWRGLLAEGKIQAEKDMILLKDSRKYEIATSCIPLLAGLRKSLDVINSNNLTLPNHDHIAKLSCILWEKLRSIKDVNTLLESPPRTGLVSFKINSTKSPKEIVRMLGKENIWIRDLEDPICLRACVHITTIHDEINSLVNSIEEICERFNN